MRGVSLAGALASSTASGSGGALPAAGRTSEQPNGGFGPPPPRVGTRPPGEGGGIVRQAASTTTPGGGGPDDDDPIKEAACGARDALSGASPDAGQALTPACDSGRRGGRGRVGRALTTARVTVETLTGVGLGGR